MARSRPQKLAGLHGATKAKSPQGARTAGTAEAEPILLQELTIPTGRSVKGTLPRWVLSVTISGGCEYVWPARFPLRGGDVLLIEPGVAQWWTTPAGGVKHWQVVYAVMRAPERWTELLRIGARVNAAAGQSGAGAAVEAVGAGCVRVRLQDGAIFGRIVGSMRRALELYRQPLEQRYELATTAVEEALWWLQAGMAQSRLGADARVRAAVAYMAQHLAEPLRVTEIARACHGSRSHVMWLFTRAMGVSLRAYFERMRMERAAQMLRLTADPVKQIAAAVGFEDARYFAKRFRRVQGCTPRGYRRG